MNFFSYFGLPVSLEIDQAQLRKAFYAKSREVHPDLIGNTDEMIAAVNNQAFKVLSEEESRFKHVLEIFGQASAENEPLPQEFLLEMMEMNEEIMEVEDQANAQVVLEKVQSFEDQLNQDIAHLRQIWPTDPSQVSAALTQINLFVIKKRYLLRMRENLSKFAPSL
jgi:molecular chaperone HscB